ncbi:MAG: YHS domain protein [Cyclobacteriaceae bacterium]|nr:YHS domain protein [Cyclobacteriaceae bacterium]
MKYFLLVLVALMLGFKSNAQSNFFTTDGVAIGGYDPVAYFLLDAPVKGNPEFIWVWNEATWYFQSDKNRELFKNNPEQYAPQFGGFCAYGVSRNYKVKSEPDAWSIVNGKLYLNYNSEVRKKWLTDKEAYIQRAEANWVHLKNTR